MALEEAARPFRVNAGEIVSLIIFVALAAIIVWLADWTSADDATPRLPFSVGALARYGSGRDSFEWTATSIWTSHRLISSKQLA
jgi:hypothetical protein